MGQKASVASQLTDAAIAVQKLPKEDSWMIGTDDQERDIQAAKKRLVEVWQLLVQAGAFQQASAIEKVGKQMFGDLAWMRVVRTVVQKPKSEQANKEPSPKVPQWLNQDL